MELKDRTHRHLQRRVMTHRQTTASLTDMFLSGPLEQKEMPFYNLDKCARLVCVCKQKLSLEWKNLARVSQSTSTRPLMKPNRKTRA